MKIIQRDSKLNRNGIPILDPPRSPRTFDASTAEREAKLRATEKHWDEYIKKQSTRHTTFKPLRRF